MTRLNCYACVSVLALLAACGTVENSVDSGNNVQVDATAAVDDAMVSSLDAPIAVADASPPDASSPDAAVCTPVDCDDTMACTENICNNGTCENPPITACVDGDGCCATGCRHQDDDDCPVSVLLVSVDNGGFTANLTTKLLATNAFASVDSHDLSAAGVPTLAALMAYDAVLVFSDNSFPDAAGLGNVLADYFDANGRVVLTMFATAAKGQVAGRFSVPANGYMFHTPGSTTRVADSLGVINDPSSPLAADVMALSCQGGFLAEAPLINGGIAAISYTSGQPLLIRGVTSAGRNRVDVNMFPADDAFQPGVGFCTGDVAIILRNALLFR